MTILTDCPYGCYGVGCEWCVYGWDDPQPKEEPQ